MLSLIVSKIGKSSFNNQRNVTDSLICEEVIGRSEVNKVVGR